MKFLEGYRTYLGSLIIIIPQVATLFGFDMTTEMVDGVKNVAAHLGNLIEAVGAALLVFGVRGAILNPTR